MIRLYIENQEMDVTEGFSHQITYAVDDLNNLDSKATAFSKTIILPGTSKNNYLLGNIFEFANANFTADGPNVGYNFNASMSAKCRLEINGLQIIKGVMRLLEIVRDGDSIEYEVAIFGELGGFVSKLGNKKIEDLDFSVYNHFYNIATIDSFWRDKSDAVFFTPIETTLLNGSPNASAEIPGDYTDYIKIGDTISFTELPISIFPVNYGTRTVESVTWDGNKTIIEVDSNWSPNPTSTFSAILLNENKAGFGIYYPLIDYGNYSDTKDDYIIYTFRPALHVYEYMDKIIKNAGYTWESKFFQTDFFKRLIIPNNQAVLEYKKTQIFFGTTIDTIFSQSSVSIVNDYTGYFTTADNKTWTYTGVQTFNGKVILNLIGRWRISNQQFTGYKVAKFVIYKNGVKNLEELVIFGIGQTFIGGLGNQLWNDFQFTYTYQPFIGYFTLATNDTFSIYLEDVDGTDILEADITGGSISLEGNPTYAPVILNDFISVNDTIPKNILQKDFFSSILKMFNLMVTENKFKERHIKIEPYTWFYNLNSDSYLDWTYKLDRSQPIRIKPMSEANARYYDIKFKADNDYYNEFYRKRFNESYGDVRYDNELEFAKDASTTEVIFSSTPLLGYNNEDKIVPTILKWKGIEIGKDEERLNSNIRIMQKKVIEDINNWNVINSDVSGTVLGNYTKYPYAGHLDDPDVPGSDINFGATKELFFSLQAGALGNNLFNTFYSPYLAEITDKDSRLVTAKFKLNDTDIFNLDFGRFIFLDGVLYRLSRIVDYTPGEICTVELLRVIYTTYDSTVNGSDDPEVNINGQIWKLNNLDTSYYANGDEIPQITDNSEWENTTEGAWCYYVNSTNNGLIYGKLYNWFAVNDPRGLAPDGWRVPTQADFNTLDSYIGGNYYKIKESGTTHWNTNNGTNETGFTALGAGQRDEFGDFDHLKVRARFWTSEAYDDVLAYYAGLNDNSSSSQGNKIDKNYGYSVRLTKDV